MFELVFVFVGVHDCVVVREFEFACWSLVCFCAPTQIPTAPPPERPHIDHGPFSHDSRQKASPSADRQIWCSGSGTLGSSQQSAGRRKTRHSTLTSTPATSASTQQRGSWPLVQRTDHPRQPGRSQFQNAQLDLRHVPSGAHC